MSGLRRAAQRGMTLVELMVVVAIVGLLMVVAVVTISRDPTVDDEANRLAHFVAEGSRKAVSGGAVAADFVSLYGISARTRMRLTTAANQQIAVLERVSEADGGWVEIGRRFVAANIRVVGYRESAELSPGLGPATVLSAGDELELRCYPDGSCTPVSGASGLTVYLREAARPEHDARMVVMPLRGVPLVLAEW